MLWRLILRFVSTRDLQDALSAREGVASCSVEPHRQRTFKLCGPCVVTVNRD